MRLDPLEVGAKARTALRLGGKVAVHAIGDLGVDWALDAIEAAQTARPGLHLPGALV